MKYIIIIITLLIFILLGMVIVGHMERETDSRLQQKTIDHLRKQIQVQKDSLTKQLTLTRDSLSIAFQTIRNAKVETERAHEQSQREINAMRKIIFIDYTYDSARENALKNLYISFKP